MLASYYSQTLSWETRGVFPLGPHLCVFCAHEHKCSLEDTAVAVTGHMCTGPSLLGIICVHPGVPSPVVNHLSVMKASKTDVSY